MYAGTSLASAPLRDSWIYYETTGSPTPGPRNENHACMYPGRRLKRLWLKNGES